MSKTIEKTQHELATCFLDVKAEVLVSEILENTKVLKEDIDVFCKSTFKRGFRRDIIGSKVSIDGNIEINLSRNGIYDALPEGVFHKAISSRSKKSYSELRQASKKEEKDARMLFAPIENELFFHKVLIEQNEKKLVREFSNLDNSFLLDFWNIKGKVADEYVFLLAKLFPLAHKISKNRNLAAQCLSTILNEEVTIEKQFLPLQNISNEIEISNILGMNCVLDVGETEVSYPRYTINIELKMLDNKDKFTKKGIGTQLISVFCEYFVPLEVDWDVNVNYTPSVSEFTLSEEKAFLGLSTNF